MNIDATKIQKPPVEKPSDSASGKHLKAYVLRFLRRPIRSVSKLIRISRPNSWIIEGIEIHSKQKLTILYSGVEINREYIAKLVYGQDYVQTYLGKRGLWSSRTNSAGGCDLVIREVPLMLKRFFNRRGRFLVPDWVVGTFDLSMDINKHISQDRTLSSNRRKIERSNLSPEITHDEDQFEIFYREMFLPYVSRRWVKQAEITEHDILKRYFREGELLLIKKDSDYIAGVLIHYAMNMPRLLVLGVKDGNFEYVELGAVAAIYQFAMQYLKEQGYHSVNVGSTRAFLNDSVLLQKKKWGFKVDSFRDYGFLINMVSTNSGVQGFFLNNPFIFMDGADLAGAIFIEANRSLEKTDFLNTYQKYHVEGLSRISLYRFSKEDGCIQECLPPTAELTPVVK
jgi:hypothetical protein